MLKKVFSLAIVFGLFFNDFGAFAMENLRPKIDYCKDEFGNIVDVDCATKALILDLKETEANQINLSEIGPNKEYRLCLWTYKNILNFADFMEELLFKTEALSNSPDDIGKFFGLNPDDAEYVLDRWVEKANIEWDQQEPVSNLEVVKKKDIRMKIYADAVKQVFEKVKQKEWMDNDLLLAKFNFSPRDCGVFVDFRKEGFKYNNKTIPVVFDKLSKKLGGIIKRYAIE